MMLDHLPDAKMVAAASWHVFTHRTFSRRLREDFEDFARSNAVVLLLVVDLVDHAEQPAVAAIQRVFQRFLKNCMRFRPWQPTIPRWEGSVHLKTVGGYVFVVNSSPVEERLVSVPQMGLSLGGVGNGLEAPRNLSGSRVRSQ